MGETLQSFLGWRHSFISSAHGSLLINTTKEGAGDPDDILGCLVAEVSLFCRAQILKKKLSQIRHIYF